MWRKGKENMAWIVHVGVDAIIVFLLRKVSTEVISFFSVCVCRGGGGSASCFY
jgi:hypothetical protein